MQRDPTGLCECGCGQQTQISKSTHRTHGYVKGQPRRFIAGHSRRKPTTYTVDETTGCWNFDGPIAPDGYGQFQVGFGRADRSYAAAHRVYYERLVGPIPDGLVLDHLCRNRPCVNPDHLEPVTIGENVLRGETLSATNAAKTHCFMGHELTPENVLLVARGSRSCRECRRRRNLEFKARKRAGLVVPVEFRRRDTPESRAVDQTLHNVEPGISGSLSQIEEEDAP